MIYFSQSFSGSQVMNGTIAKTGNYYSIVNLDFNSPALSSFHSNSLDEIYFDQIWQSIDKQITYSRGQLLKFKKYSTFDGGSIDNALIISIKNFKQEYRFDQTVRFDVLLTDNPNTITKFSRFETTQNLLSKEVFYRVIDAYTREEIIPFTTESNGTNLSFDSNGLFFKMDMSNLIKNKVYEFEFIKYSNLNISTHFKNLGYRFKVI
jgi:hypothetical protein